MSKLKSNGTFKKQPQLIRDKIHCVFIDAATVFEYDGDWRAIFKKAGYQTQGHSKKMFETMAKATDTQMDNFVSQLIYNVKQVRYEKTTASA